IRARFSRLVCSGSGKTHALSIRYRAAWRCIGQAHYLPVRLKESMQGKVTAYDEKHGYCLVLTDVGNIVFLPIGVIKANAYHYLPVGQAVEIEAIPTALTAVTVSKI